MCLDYLVGWTSKHTSNTDSCWMPQGELPMLLWSSKTEYGEYAYLLRRKEDNIRATLCFFRHEHDPVFVFPVLLSPDLGL